MRMETEAEGKPEGWQNQIYDLLQRLDEREREAGSGQLAHRSHGS